MQIKRKNNQQPRKAFTLVEVLLVLAIIAAIAAMVIPNLLGTQQKALVKRTQTDIKALENTIKMYAIDNDGQYPEGSTEDVLAILLSTEDAKTGKTRPSYLENIPYDPWDNSLQYEYPATGNKQTASGKPAIWSFGPDKQDGTDDDINNWDDPNQL
jgi:general secretion pathway protein G